MMETITIQTEAQVVKSLKALAQRKHTTVEEIVQEAIERYLQTQPETPKAYSFIGIGRSGKGNISTQVEETLAQAANRREGWSLSE